MKPIQKALLLLLCALLIPASLVGCTRQKPRETSLTRANITDRRPISTSPPPDVLFPENYLGSVKKVAGLSKPIDKLWNCLQAEGYLGGGAMELLEPLFTDPDLLRYEGLEVNQVSLTTEPYRNGWYFINLTVCIDSDPQYEFYFVYYESIFSKLVPLEGIDSVLPIFCSEASPYEYYFQIAPHTYAILPEHYNASTDSLIFRYCLSLCERLVVRMATGDETANQF